MSKIEIGDTVFFPVVGQECVSVVCPICDGTGKVILILGNGDSMELPCDYCGRGYEGPTGRVSEYKYSIRAGSGVVKCIDITVDGNGEHRRYHINDRYLEEKDVFQEEAPALEAAKLKAEQIERDNNARADYIKKDRAKSFSWHAGYHLREAKRNRKDAEYHDKMAVLCKARAKDDS